MTLKVALVLGSAGLALWTYVRFAGHTPRDWRAVVAHVAVSLVFVTALVPAMMTTTLEHPLPGSGVVAVVGVALPAFAYVFLASLWLLALAGRALGQNVR